MCHFRHSIFLNFSQISLNILINSDVLHPPPSSLPIVVHKRVFPVLNRTTFERAYVTRFCRITSISYSFLNSPPTFVTQGGGSMKVFTFLEILSTAKPRISGTNTDSKVQFAPFNFGLHLFSLSLIKRFFIVIFCYIIDNGISDIAIHNECRTLKNLKKLHKIVHWWPTQ